jgi:two-component system, sensor histidine kinase and response regulator
MTIKKKLILGFLTLILIVSTLGTFAIILSDNIEEKIEEINKSNFIEIRSSTQLDFHLQRLKSNIREVLLEAQEMHKFSIKFHDSGNHDLSQLKRSGQKHLVELTHATQTIRASNEAIISAVNNWQNAIVSGIEGEGFDLDTSGFDEEKEMEELQHIKKHIERSKVLTDTFLSTFKPSNFAIHQDPKRMLDLFLNMQEAFEAELEPTSRAIQGEIKELVEETDEEMEFVLEIIHRHAENTLQLSIAIIILVGIVSIIVGVILYRSISAPLSKLQSATQEIETGHFVLIEDIKSSDELGRLSKSFNRMSNSLQVSMEKLNEAKTQAEEEKLNANKANMAKSDFLANMSHEIRTPMNAVIGLTNLAQHIDSSPRMRDYLAKISGSSRSLLRIINDILDFSKIEAGKLELDPVEFLLGDVFNHLSDMFREKTAANHIELIMGASEECQYGLYGDSLRLEQILINLLSNAVKFTEEGEIEVTAKALTPIPDYGCKGPITMEFSIRDSGIGMNSSQTHKLFQPFEQADGSTTRKFGGTGLGLSISRRLVEIMGGSIKVESVPHQGTVFSFTCQFQWLPEANEWTNLNPPEDMQRLKTLVVDDNATALAAVSELLRSFGFEVLTARSGAEAVEMIESNNNAGTSPIQLILIDALMPGMTGLQVMEAITQSVSKVTGEITDSTFKTIMMVEFGSEDTLKNITNRLPVDGHIVKPANCSILFNTIMEVFGKEVVKYMRPGMEQLDPHVIARQIGGARVLLVEDNAINQQVASEILASVGLIVEVAENGKVAIEMLAELEYDVVLMDIQMPVMDGLTTAQQIRQEARFRDLPIIAMTAHAMEKDREKSSAVGMNDHITKPIDQKQLFASLIKWIPEKERLMPLAPILNIVEEKPSWLSDELPGIDIGSALQRLNNNHRTLLSILLELLRDYANATEKIRTALQGKRKEDHENAIRLAHSIKGVAGNISAKKLTETASSLEKALKDNQSHMWPDLLLQFEQALNPIIEGISGLKVRVDAIRMEENAVNSNTETTLDKEAVSSTMRNLAGQMSEMDVTALDTFEELKELLTSKTELTELEKLDSQMDSLDFDDALVTLVILAKELSVNIDGEKS